MGAALAYIDAEPPLLAPVDILQIQPEGELVEHKGSPDPERLKAALDLLELIRDLGIKADLQNAQEIACRAPAVLHAPEKLEELAKLLWLAPELLTHKAAQ